MQLTASLPINIFYFDSLGFLANSLIYLFHCGCRGENATDGNSQRSNLC